MKSCPTCKATYPTHFTVCPQDGTPLRSLTELVEGTVLRGKYEILSKLGEGGMGAVYKVRHVHFDEVGALKIVSSRLLSDEAFLKRFRSEALVMRRLDHPHAVRVQDFDETEDGRPFMVMEYVEGELLDALLADGQPLDARRAITICMQVCDALEAAHRLGIIHRDIKPSNIMVARAPEGGPAAALGTRDLVKVFDFGIAKIKEGSSLRSGVSLTQAGFVVGTPAYMSPEQCQGLRGDKIDGRTDLYSLGIVLYQMLTGRVPFEGESSVELLMAHIQAQPPDPRTVRATLTPALVEVVLRALEKDPAKRYVTAAEMHDALEAALQLESIDTAATVAVFGRKTPPPAAPPIPPIATPTEPRTPTPMPVPAPSAVIPSAQVEVEAPPLAPTSPEKRYDAVPPRAARPRHIWLYVSAPVVLLVVLLISWSVLRMREPAPPASQPESVAAPAPSPPETTPPTSSPVTGSGAVTSARPAPALPTAEQVFARYVQARGGEAAFRAWTNYSATGTFEFRDDSQGQRLTGTFEILEKSPDRFLQALVVNGRPFSREGYDGTRGWTQDVQGGVRELTHEQILGVRRNSTFYHVRHLRELYATLQLAGQETLTGRLVHVVEATPEGARPERMYFDVETGLLLRRDSYERELAGGVVAQKYFEDYRDSCGARMAWTERVIAAQQRFTFRITSLDCNILLSDDLFRQPAAATAEQPAARGSGVTGQYAGRIENFTTQTAAGFSIVWEERDGALAGCVMVARPLAGNGPIEGEVRGNTINFRRSSPYYTIEFRGVRQGDILGGTYYVTAPNLPPQQGRFMLQKRSATLPPGFDPANCPVD